MPDHTIQTSRITLPHLILEELISVKITPPTAPNNFWGVSKRNSQENLHQLVLSLLGKAYTIFYAKKFSRNSLA